MTSPQQSTPAVVLGTQPLGEADLLVVLLTPALGKIRAAARNARKSRRRFAGGLPGGALGEAALGRRSAQGLWRLDGFRSVRDLGILGRDLTRFAHIAYVCEITDALVAEPEPDPRRFVALAAVVGALLDPDRPPIPATLRRFELRLLDSLGLLPALQACCVCGGALARIDAASIPFDVARGGALCAQHGLGVPGLDARLLELAGSLVAEEEPGTHSELAVQAAPEGIRRGLRDLTASLVRAQLRRPLRSLQFFAGTAPRLPG
jgi:DNA repair protein RecO (recombination protein O)